MLSNKFVQTHKTSIIFFTLFSLLIIILTPGILKYISEYNLMAQELNRLGVPLDSLNKSSNIKIAQIDETSKVAETNKPKHIKEKIITNEPTAISVNNDPKIEQIQPTPTKIDYKPLQEAMDSAIGIEEDTQTGPFTEPKITKPIAEPYQNITKIAKKTPKNKITKLTTPSKKQLKKHKINNKDLTYAVQLASFKNKASAYSLEKKLKSSGFNAIVKLNKKIYRVLVISTKNSKSEANKLHKRILLKYKINGYIKQINV